MTSQFHWITTPCCLTLPTLCIFLNQHVTQQMHCTIHHLWRISTAKCFDTKVPASRSPSGSQHKGPSFYRPSHLSSSLSLQVLVLMSFSAFLFLVYLATPLHLDNTECPKSHFSEILSYTEYDCWHSHSAFVFATVGNTVVTPAIHTNCAAPQTRQYRFLNFVHRLIFFKEKQRFDSIFCFLFQ